MLTMVLAGADVEPLMNKGLVVRVGVEPLIGEHAAEMRNSRVLEM